MFLAGSGTRYVLFEMVKSRTSSLHRSGLLLSSVISQLWEENSPPAATDLVRKSSHRTAKSTASRRRRSTRSAMMSLESAGVPTPDSLSKQLSRRTNFNLPDDPVSSPWEGLQSPLGPNLGLEEEVMELRRRASAAAGQTRKLQEEKKWALSQGNPARAFQLGWSVCAQPLGNLDPDVGIFWARE